MLGQLTAVQARLELGRKHFGGIGEDGMEGFVETGGDGSKTVQGLVEMMDMKSAGMGVGGRNFCHAGLRIGLQQYCLNQ